MEQRDLGYMPFDGARHDAASTDTQVDQDATAGATLVDHREFGPVDLFRFSALTYNSHRIHYDEPYVTEVEGYPGLVVHGPMLAVQLAELVRHRYGTDAMTSFTFRAVAPAFAGETVTFVGWEDESGRLDLQARCQGRILMRATCEVRR